MDPNSEHIQYVLLLYLKKEKMPSKIIKRLSWFRRYKNRNFDLKGAPHSYRPIEAKTDVIVQNSEEERYISSRYIS